MKKEAFFFETRHNSLIQAEISPPLPCQIINQSYSKCTSPFGQLEKLVVLIVSPHCQLVKFSKIAFSSGMANKIVIVPGNGCTNIRRANWYDWLATSLEAELGSSFKVICETFPDPYEAKETIWIPFMKETLGGTSTQVCCAIASQLSRQPTRRLFSLVTAVALKQ